MLERKLVKLLRRLPEWLVLSGAFACYLVFMFGFLFVLAFIHNWLGGV